MNIENLSSGSFASVAVNTPPAANPLQTWLLTLTDAKAFALIIAVGALAAFINNMRILHEMKKDEENDNSHDLF